MEVEDEFPGIGEDGGQGYGLGYSYEGCESK